MSQQITATRLKCEYFENPLGIDAQSPRFSFVPLQEGRNRRQSAYRIVVGTMHDIVAIGEGDMWDSGFVRSKACANIVYDGAPLKSGTRYYFSVQLKDADGEKGPISEVSCFETGLLQPGDWQGCFIGMPAQGPAQLLRREFTLDKPVAWARAYVAGLGYYELHINGSRIGDRVMEPGFTDYTKRVFYSVYDVTSNLVQGENCIGACVGSGWYKHPSLLLQLNIRYTDGTCTSVYTEPGKWDMLIAPITYTNIYTGENYDYRFEAEGWDRVCPDLTERFPRAGWRVYAAFMPSPAGDEHESYNDVYHKSYIALEAEAPGGRLEAQPIEPIRIVRRIHPVKIENPKPGIYVADFGENVAGWTHINAQTEKDALLALRHSEILFEDGTVNQSYLIAAELYGSGAQMQSDYFRTAGGKCELEPKFTYHGFRYVQIEGLSYEPEIEDIWACVVHSDVVQRGFFRCSDEMINRLQDIVLRTETDNLHSIPTDCPQRDERMGWLNDMTVRYEEAIYNFDMVHIYEKWAQDISDAQEPVSGAIPDTAPLKRGQRPADPCTASYLLVSDGLLDHCGDIRTVERQYESYKKWVDYLYRQSIDGILTYSYWGDWAGPTAYNSIQMNGAISAITPGELVSTGYLYYNLRLMEKYARLVHPSEADGFAARADKVRDAFNREFFRPETGTYATGSQACNVLPLFLGIVPQGREADVAAALNADVVAKDYHLSTGNLCTKYVPEQLTRYGYTDTAFKLITQTTYPSWGYMLSMGATTVWERWEYATSTGMNSHNHPMYASISAYFYKYLAGIAAAPASGFDSLTICPCMPSGLEWVSAELDTVRGRVSSAWKREEDAVVFDIEIPVGAKAELLLPSGLITEGGEAPAGREGISPLGIKDGKAAFMLGSGKYSFRVE